MELETRRKSGQRGLNGGPYRAVTLYLAPLPVLSGLVIVAQWLVLARMPFAADRWSWTPFARGPFARATCLWTMAFGGMTYRFYPTVVPDRLTIHAAASAPESLKIILFGTCIELPTILLCTVLAYCIHRGKATALRYD